MKLTFERNMTASWVRNRAQAASSSSTSSAESPALCQYYENFEREGNDADMPLGVYDLDQLKELGRQRGWCPYFLTRRVRFISFALV
jgi:DNA excision repair protein ERCC-2